MRTAVLAVALAAACYPATLGEEISRIIKADPDARAAFWGLRVVDARTGEVVHARNDKRFFVPASNTKLFTTSLALTRLGPDYRFHTVVEADARPDGVGRVRELRLIGGGDPNLSARILPYKRGPQGTNPLAAIDALAERVAASGVRIVLGDIVGDDTAYEYDPYPDGWAVDDPIYEYGAPVSALTLNDNALRIELAPGEKSGEPATIRVYPAVEHLIIHNRVVTVTAESGRIRYERLPGSRELTVRGSISVKSPPRSTLIAVHDPALFAAEALRNALVERGIEVRGGISAVHRRTAEEPAPERGTELARHTSAPLAQILQVINKVSQNLHTEMLLREIARVKTGFGAREAGLEEITTYLNGLGVDEKQYRFEDASGLSRLTLVTPAAITAVLVHMYNGPQRENWVATLPVGGADGTLFGRFSADPVAGQNIRAKTGSISHVGGLSGYAFRKDGSVYAFSILANNFNSEHASIRKVMDGIALALLE